METLSFETMVAGVTLTGDKTIKWDDTAVRVSDFERGVWLCECLETIVKQGCKPGDSMFISSGDSVVFARISRLPNHDGTHDVAFYECIVKARGTVTVVPGK